MIPRFTRLTIVALVSAAIVLSPIVVIAADYSPAPAPVAATATDPVAQSDQVAEKKAKKKAKKDKKAEKKAKKKAKKKVKQVEATQQ